jgi:hypothetical protein
MLCVSCFLFSSGRESSSSPVQSSTMSADRKQRKNFREKQRRNELNEHFDALCVLLNLNSKVEKSNVLFFIFIPCDSFLL